MDERTKNANPEAIAERIREAETIAVVSHVNPDGDTLGCCTAMGLALKRMGKKVTMLCDGKVPDVMDYLPGAAEIRRPSENEGPFDLMLTVDVSDEARMGACAGLKAVSRKTAQIDHHPTNPFFMETNWVDGTAPAACLMIRKEIAALGIPMDREIAICLYTGISTDTGNFAFASTNAECFRVMAELTEYGLPIAELNRRLFREKPRAQAKLLGRALESLSFPGDGRIAVMKLTRRDYAECGALSEHTDTLVNYGLDTPGTEMALLGRETDGGQVKFSLRAKEPARVSEAAKALGGGGHPQASGITMDGTLDECIGKALAEMRKYLD